MTHGKADYSTFLKLNFDLGNCRETKGLKAGPHP